MQLKQLLYFISIAECGSFTQAAKNLYIAQSSLSQSLQSLERELGFTLFQRSRNGVKLTGMGEIVYHDAKELIDSVEHLTESWKSIYQDRKSLNGLVRIGIVPGSYPILTHYVLPVIKESFSDIRFQISEATTSFLVSSLVHNRADLIIGHCLKSKQEQTQSAAKEKGFEWIVLREDTYKIAVGKNHPLSNRESLRAEDVKGIPLACYVGEDPAAELFFQELFDPALAIEYTSIETMIQNTLSGENLSVLPEITIRNNPALTKNSPDTLRFLSIEGFNVPFTHFASYKKDQSPSRELELVLQKTLKVFHEDLI